MLYFKSSFKIFVIVVSAVASQIGYSWKGLARYLEHVKEGTLEKIEEDESNTTNEMKARLVSMVFA